MKLKKIILRNNRITNDSLKPLVNYLISNSTVGYLDISSN